LYLYIFKFYQGSGGGPVGVLQVTATKPHVSTGRSERVLSCRL
jgi:hypothetical protein